MTPPDLLLLVVLSVAVGGLWGRISLRQATFFGSRRAEVVFFLAAAGVTTAIYALIAAREPRYDIAPAPAADSSFDFWMLIGIFFGGVAFLGAPAFACFRAIRSTQRAELRGYIFALTAILGVGLGAAILNAIHYVDDPPAYRPSLMTLVMHGACTLPAVAALVFVVTRWRRLSARPARPKLST